ncbi:MAG: phosphatidate cytidylyltransferase [Isosphaeraceae bacterium]
MLSTRLVFGILMVAGLLAALWLDEMLAPWYPFWFLLAAAVMIGAAREVIGLLGATSASPSANSVVGGVLAILVANWMPHLVENQSQAEAEPALLYDPGRPLDVLAWPFLTFIAVLMASFVVQSVQFNRPGRTMAKIAGTILAVAYVGLLGSFVVQQRWFEGRHQGLMAIAFLVATAKGSDTGAYTLGRIAGRHKLWPQLSPKKTVEGAIGGLIFGVGAAMLVSTIARRGLGIPAFSLPLAALYGLVVAAVAQLGDLMESMIKRDCEQKDASQAVPGFGGVLDVIDSLIFAGPIAYALWMWFGP